MIKKKRQETGGQHYCYGRFFVTVNTHFGEFTVTLAPAQLLNYSQMPNVIAPTWKRKVTDSVSLLRDNN